MVILSFLPDFMTSLTPPRSESCGKHFGNKVSLENDHQILVMRPLDFLLHVDLEN